MKMGLLTKIIEPEIQISNLIDELFGDVPDLPTLAEPSAPAAITDSPPDRYTCKTCHLRILWFSVYNDGVIRCRICEPPPAERLVRGYIVDGLQLREYLRPVCEHATDSDHLDDPRFEFGGIDPWSDHVSERFDHHEHFGWPMLILKNEFRKALATRGRSGR